MGKNKHKKILKQKNKKNKVEAVVDLQQQNIEDENQDNQHFIQSQGIFQQLANINPQITQSKQNNQVINKDLQSKLLIVKKCKLNNGWIYILNINQCYHIINKDIVKVQIAIIDGSIDINGKIYYQLFCVKSQSNLVIQCKENINSNKTTNISNKGQKKSNKVIVIDNQNKIEKNKKNKQKGKKQNIKNMQEEQQQHLKFLNKNVQQIVSKIENNIFVTEANQKINTSLSQQITVNIKKIKVSEQVTNFLADYQATDNILIFTQNENVDILECEKNRKPWDNIQVQNYTGKAGTTLLIGSKNTGKSMFCDYLENQSQLRNTEICIMDLDIGRGRIFPGCVSLSYRGSTKKNEDMSIWIGQYTPLNSIPTYIKAIQNLHEYYRQKYFTSSLIINTMGYLTGLGELMLYQIFNIVKPQRVLIIEGPSSPQHIIINAIQNNIKSGRYVDRLYFNNTLNSTRTSTKIQKFINYFANSKSAPQRFQTLLTHSPLKTIDDLIMLILTGKMKSLQKNIDLYQSSREGNITKIDENNKCDINMRLIFLGSLWKDGQFLLKNVAYGWEDKIYYDPVLMQEQNCNIGSVADGIDFQRIFYLVNQSRIIQIESFLDRRLNYISPIYKALGNKGMRNNSAKKILVNRP